MESYLRSNLDLWNEWAVIHANLKSDDYSYNIEAFKRGRSTLYQLDIDEVGDVAGKTLLHLQCHIGLDTLSWARRGARVTGADFSDKAIAVAQGLSDELGLDGRFVRSDLYALPDVLPGQFDVVYTSYGVLSWLPDIARWGQVAAHFVKPGGVFYIAEIHPVPLMFDERAAASLADLRPAFNYFHTPEPSLWPVQGSYADPSAPVRQKVEYNWAYTLGGVATALIQAGLTVEFIHEFPECCYRHFPWMVRGEDGWWRQPDGRDLLPMTFTLRARK